MIARKWVRIETGIGHSPAAFGTLDVVVDAQDIEPAPVAKP